MTKPIPTTEERKLYRVGFYKLSGKVLGKGNFARVEEGIHTLLNTKVAIKVLDTSKIKEKYVAKNLDREARMLSQLQHPSIVCLYETMRAGCMYYLVTELATGGDLCTYIKRHRVGKLDERCARRYGRQIISALAHMHNRGIVHRDLKMENIMLDANREHVKIVDFGLSNTWEAGSLLQTHCGSPEYAAPELFVVGQCYGPEVDLWSLGVIMYGMVTGRLPFLSPRDENLSAHERRRHLLIQINRGLTQHQRKPLCGMSQEFRNMVTHLLTPDTETRISLEELMFHPWVTNRQKKILPNVVSTLPTTDEHANIMQRISEKLDVTQSYIQKELMINNYGKVGGIYNIMAHVQRLVHTEMHGIAWVNSAPHRSSSTNRPKTTKTNSTYRTQQILSAIRPRTSPPHQIPGVSRRHQQLEWAVPEQCSRSRCHSQHGTCMMSNTTRIRSKTPSGMSSRCIKADSSTRRYDYGERPFTAGSSLENKDIKKQLQMERRCMTPTNISRVDNGLHAKKSVLNYLVENASFHPSRTSRNSSNKEVLRRVKELQSLAPSVLNKQAELRQGGLRTSQYPSGSTDASGRWMPR